MVWDGLRIRFHTPCPHNRNCQVTGAPNQSLRPRYDAIRWDNDDALFAAWCEGMTGFPVVDAAMRQLNATGFMHNRCRMVVASFMIKDLGIDWRWGERYFASKLVDVYHPANVGGWGWASGAGADAQQYNRVFNPWLQTPAVRTSRGTCTSGTNTTRNTATSRIQDL